MTGPLFNRNTCLPSHHATSALLLISMLLSITLVSAFPITKSISFRTHLNNGQTDKTNPSSKQARRFFYRDTHDDDPEDGNNPHEPRADLVRTNRNDWRQHLFPSSVSIPVTDQDKVDEYLEFLDKRYHRLYDSNKSTKKQFPALNWLMGDTDDKTDSNSVDQHENALFVLGVAELASDRLLQNLQIRVQQEKEDALNEASSVIDAISTSVDVSIKTKMAADTLIQAGSTVLSRISARRAALIAYQERQLARVFRFSFQTIAVGPAKAILAIWNFGGGQKSITLTLSVLTAILVFLGPLVQVAVKNLIVRKQSS